MNQDVKRHDDEGYGWLNHEGFYRRNYPSYEAYVKKQVSKLDKRQGWCRERSNELREYLRIRLTKLAITKPGISVLCIGARLGGEVLAFLDLGCFALGIDLNPGEQNPVVLHGDFHKLQFASDSIDLVYFNSLDHAYEPIKVLSEIHRVLKSDGLFMLELKAGSDEKEIKPMGSDHWDCLEWDSMKQVVEFVSQNGFNLMQEHYSRKSKATPYTFIFGKLS